MKIKTKITIPKSSSKKEDDLILPEVIHDRATTNFAHDNNFSTEERVYKENPVASRFSFDLFKENEAATINPVIRIRHMGSGDTEKWRVFEDNKNTFTLEASKISKKEKLFLHSVDGARFLLAKCKSEGLTINGLRVAIKNELSRKLKKPTE